MFFCQNYFKESGHLHEAHAKEKKKKPFSSLSFTYYIVSILVSVIKKTYTLTFLGIHTSCQFALTSIHHNFMSHRFRVSCTY